MNNEPHVLKLVPIDSKVFFWLLKSAAKHHWYACIKGLVFSLIITARYVTRLRMLHSRSWAAEMYGCLRNTQVLNMATSASKRKSVL